MTRDVKTMEGLRAFTQVVLVLSEKAAGVVARALETCDPDECSPGASLDDHDAIAMSIVAEINTQLSTPVEPTVIDEEKPKTKRKPKQTEAQKIGAAMATAARKAVEKDES